MTGILIGRRRYSNKCTLVIELPKKQVFNLIKVRENIKLGQRIDSMKVDAWVDGGWKEIAEATSIGACRIIRLEP